MRNYELTYLISSGLSEEELKRFQEKIISLIQEVGGTLGETKEPIRKKVAYLATLNFHLSPEKLDSLEKRLKSENQIIRYMILVRKAPKKVLEVAIKSKKIIKPEPKVELKEIEKKLEEILDEQ
jgi:ribosomal protein S6